MLSACGCMGISWNLSRANVGALNVLLGALVSFPVTVPLCVFLWTCHLQPSRPTLPPSHSSPNSDLMLTSCWPLTRIFIFLQLVVLFCVLLKTHFFKCPHCDRYPSHRLCTQHQLGWGKCPSLSHSFCLCSWPYFVSHVLSYCCSFLLFLTLSFPSFAILSFPECLHVHEAGLHCLSPLTHDDTGMRGNGISSQAMISQTLPPHLMLLGQQTCLCMACLLSMTLLSVSVRPQSSVLWGREGELKKGHGPFFVTCVCSVHVWMLWLFCMLPILWKSFHLVDYFEWKYVSMSSMSVVWGSVWYCASSLLKMCSMGTHWSVCLSCVSISVCVKVVWCKCFVFHICVCPVCHCLNIWAKFMYFLYFPELHCFVYLYSCLAVGTRVVITTFLIFHCHLLHSFLHLLNLFFHSLFQLLTQNW